LLLPINAWLSAVIDDNIILFIYRKNINPSSLDDEIGKSSPRSHPNSLKNCFEIPLGGPASDRACKYLSLIFSFNHFSLSVGLVYFVLFI